ncbi:MAG: laminin G domain-containing protein [Paludibacteraceae bacterium]|nr:laminin G domain-containing protein [Paludibacteraceae bacterium]
MKPLHFSLRGLLMAALVSFSLSVSANDWLERADNFSAYSLGQGKVHFKILIYANGAWNNYWVEDHSGNESRAYYQIKDGDNWQDPIDIVHFRTTNDKCSDRGAAKGWVKFKVRSGMILTTNEYDGVKRQYSSLDDWHEIDLMRQSSGDKPTWFEFDWSPELSTNEKTYKCTTTIYTFSKWGYHDSYTYPLGEFQGAEQDKSPTLYNPFFYTGNENGIGGYGYLAVPYVTYQDMEGYTTSMGASMTTTDRSGMIYVQSADTMFYGFYIDARTHNTVTPTTIQTLRSNNVEIPAYHKLYNLRVEPYWEQRGANKVYDYRYRRISWDIKRPSEHDIYNNDMFELQRATDSTFSDATTITTISMDLGSAYKLDTGALRTHTLDGGQQVTDTVLTQATFSYVDSMPESWYNKKGGGHYYYRVRRSSSSLWGWEGHDYAKSTKSDNSVPYLSYLNATQPNYVKDVQFDQNRKVHFTINLYNENADNTSDVKPVYYWDPRVSIIVNRITEETHDTIKLVVPKDSIFTIVGDNGCPTIQAHFTDKANYICTHVKYEVVLDTAGAGRLPVPESIDISKPTPLNGESLYYTDDISIHTFATTEEAYPDYSLLQWQLANAPSDEYVIARRPADTVEWKDIATTQDSWYADSVNNSDYPAAIEYDYRLVTRYTCNGHLLTDTAYVKGKRSPYGSISGYIRYADGTGCPDITVRANYGDSIVCETLTDETGLYILDSLDYGGLLDPAPTPQKIYTISPTSTTGAVFRYNNTSSPTASITLQPKKSKAEQIDFENTSCVRMSGRVLYEKSTIPVRDVQFLVNGKPVKVGGQLYKTNALGDFQFNVPKDVGFTIQAVKDGHVFCGNGFVYIHDKDTITLSKALDGVLIYDSTKVALSGRIVGGATQAAKPLGFGMSTNNLGDDLQMVLELEGDNISHIVADPEDDMLTTIDTVYAHHISPTNDVTGNTYVRYERKRIIVRPDSLTGEYRVELAPARYKISQATAEGYSTLFGKGKTSEVIDITNAPLEHLESKYDTNVYAYNARYDIIYKAPINLTYKQLNYGSEVNYLGESQITDNNHLGKPFTVNVATPKSDGTVQYAFGYPVFKSGPYSFRITAQEDYYYNNDPYNPHHEYVRLKNCNVRIYNGMHDSVTTQISEALLNTVGQVDITLPIDYVTFTKVGEMALRVIDFSVYSNGEYIESQPLRGFILGQHEDGSDVIGAVKGDIRVLDVLRDPPGSKSYSYLEKGSNYSYSYQYGTSVKAGAAIGIRWGNSVSTLTGTTAAGTLAGTYTQTESSSAYALPLTGSAKTDNKYYYTMTISERITTSSDEFHVGSMADVYIGASTNMYYRTMETVSILDSTTYAMLIAQGREGRYRIVQSGVSDGKAYYIAVSQKMGIGTEQPVSFVYTQEHILSVVVPELKRARDQLLIFCTKEEAQALAKSTKKPVYRSLLPVEHSDFGSDTTYYERYYPDDSGSYIDEVEKYNHEMLLWRDVIIANEEEKAKALNGSSGELLRTHAISDGVKVEASESYAYSNFYSALWSPFDMSADIDGGALGKLLDKVGSGVAAGIKALVALIQAKGGSANQSVVDDDDDLELDDEASSSSGSAPALQTNGSAMAKWGFIFKPILDFSINKDNGKTVEHSKSIGYVLETDPYGYMDVSVYRTKITKNEFDSLAMETRTEAFNVELEPTDGKTADGKDIKINYIYGGLVFYLNGGASRCPYEAEDYTFLSKTRTKISNGTLEIEKPRIDIDIHERSNVPKDKPAIFNLRITNETEADFGNGAQLIPFVLRLNEITNPKGAKIYVDGAPLATPRTILIGKDMVINKTMEVYAGEGYDYEDIEVQLASECYYPNVARAKFSVHYMPVSCDVNIATPHDKWILNTLSPQDSVGYYLPVVIDGFDVNYANFDHIELQYKLSSRSDDAWTTLCSYFHSDSLYKAASGTKEMITSGRIENIHFYGERDPIEQQYDLRAVSFCRHGSSFITRSSAVISGIKDTRPPVLFDNPRPANSILAIGDNLGLRFSEAIAGNYLDETNNFQLVGITNETSFTPTTSVVFDGTPNSYAESQVSRNMSNRSFSIDMLVRPTNPKEDNCFFSHGDQLSFGLRSDGRLYLNAGNFEALSDTLPTEITAFTRVIVTYDNTTGNIHFYEGTQEITADKTPTLKSYTGTAPFVLGKGLKGSMAEVRIWYEALPQDKVVTTHMCHLTGYERNLAAYYPMNEGRGTSLSDKANGATIELHGASWQLPEGFSIQLDGTQPVHLEQDLLSRSRLQDYTFMFWFRTTTADASLFTAGWADSTGTKVAIEKGNLVLHAGKNSFEAGAVNDDQWHHYALVVNRMYNNAVAYLDGQIIHTLSATQLDAFAGVMALGENGYKGYFDEIAVFEQALPQQLISTFLSASPIGDEMGLMAYLPFEKQVTNANGIIELVFSLSDQRVFKNSEGTVINKDQPLVIKTDRAYTTAAADNTICAPVHNREVMSKLNFTWTFDNTELLINLKMQDKEVNKQSLYITVRDVEDLNGNPMVSPVTWSAFVDRNSLKWTDRDLKVRVLYGETDQPAKQEIKIINHSGVRHQYTIEKSAEWLDINLPNGSVDPTDNKAVTFSFNTQLPVGVYSDLVYLTDENGLAEPLRVELTVEAECPWEDVEKGKYDNTMSLRGQVFIEGENGVGYFDSDENDVVAVFCEGEMVGKANNTISTFSEATTKSFVYLTIHGNSQLSNKVLSFKLWQASTGRIFNLQPSATQRFKANDMCGISPAEPIRLTTTAGATQQLALEEGWNWISWYLQPTSSYTNDLLTAEQGLNNGDIVKSPINQQFSEFVLNDTAAAWKGTLRELSNKYMYMLRLAEPMTLNIEGKTLTDDQRVVTLRNGWNSLSYMLDAPAIIRDALADYFDNASVGDVIKSKTQFAVFTEDSKWEGSLQTMQPGKGYLFRRLGEGNVTMRYTKPTASNVQRRALAAAQDNSSEFTNPKAASNMTMIATINAEGNKRSEGTINVFIGNDLVGMAEPILVNDEVFYFLTIQSDKVGDLRFELDGQALTPENGAILYEADAHSGSLKAPVVLRTADDIRPYKVIENNHVIIIRNNEKYDLNGKKL